MTGERGWKRLIGGCHLSDHGKASTLSLWVVYQRDAGRLVAELLLKPGLASSGGLATGLMAECGR